MCPARTARAGNRYRVLLGWPVRSRWNRPEFPQHHLPQRAGGPKENTAVSMVDTPAERWNTLLDGPQRAHRPTGPLLGVVIVLVCLIVGQLLASAALFPLFGLSPQAVLGGMDALTEFVTLLADAGALLLLALWLWFKERRPFHSLGFF